MITVRPFEGRDAGFVLETACKIRWPKGTTFREWFAAYVPQVTRWVREGTCLVVDAGDGVTVLGYLIESGGVLRSLYVKRDFRGHGFGLDLLGATTLTRPLRVQDPTPSFNAWARHHKLDVLRAE